MNSFTQDPITLVLALLGGLVPAYLWLRFWLKEDRERPEPKGLLFLTFAGGTLAVILVLPIQKWIANFPYDQTTLLVLWAAAEEILKFLAVFFLVFASQYLDEPVDYPIYFITAGLGFAALENTLFLIHPVGLQDTTVSLLTGSLRFLGSTLLHAVASGFIGLLMGLAFFHGKFVKFLSFLVGIGLAIALHSTFNYFIMKNDGEDFLQVFAFLWVVTIISMLVFEKLRRLSEPLYLRDTKVSDMSLGRPYAQFK